MRTEEEITKKLVSLVRDRDRETAEGVKGYYSIQIHLLKWVLK